MPRRRIEINSLMLLLRTPTRSIGYGAKRAERG
jgi:hypothetical protein